MKEISELNLPENVMYSKDHEWARTEDGTIKIGISDYAQDQLGDIVFVEMPSAGDTFSAGDEFGSVESVKAVSELYMPVSGEIVAINADLEDTPELLNQDPYKNWIIEIKPADVSETDALMSKDDYLNLLKGL